MSRRARDYDESLHDKGRAMSARAERRRAAREAARSTRPEPSLKHGGVIGRLDDGRTWVVCFNTVDTAQRFLQLLGPPPASEPRLRAALKDMAAFHSVALH